MLQYENGEFSNIIPFDEAHEEFLKQMNLGKAISLHTGPIDHLHNLMRVHDENHDIMRRLESVEEKIEELQTKKVKSKHLHIPTDSQIEQFSKYVYDENPCVIK